MRKLAFMGVFLLVAAMGCKDDDDETETPTPVLPELKVTSTLAGTTAIPANPSTATGEVEGTLDQETRILKLNVMYSDSAMSDTTASDSLMPFVPTAWHIYKASADSLGTSVINLGTTFTSPFAFTDTLTADQVTDLKAGNYYLNIGTAKYPNGEVRGKLTAAE